MLEIQFFGELNLTIDGKSVGRPSSTYGQAILAKLVMKDGDFLSRADLAAQTWPNSETATAKARLRRELHGLRAFNPLLRSSIESIKGCIAWTPKRKATVDVIQFSNEYSIFLNTNSTNRQRAEMASSAIKTYSADLLTRIDDEWVNRQRMVYENKYIKMIEYIAAYKAEFNRHHESIELIDQLIKRCPLREIGYRLKMEMHYLGGDTALSLQTYDQCASTLRAEAGIEPSKMLASYKATMSRNCWTKSDRIPNDNLRLSDDSDAATHGIKLNHQINEFVGRQRYLHALNNQWRSAAVQTTHLMTVEGEPGIGKSRLVRYFLEQIDRDDAMVLSARCYAAEGELAYSPIREILLTSIFDSAIESLDLPHRLEISRAFPEVTTSDNLISNTAEQGVETSRQRLFEALATLFSKRGLRIILFLDDLQWCDKDTLEWVRFLFRYDTQSTLLVIATARNTELSKDHPASVLIQQLDVDDQHSSLKLGTLSFDESIGLMQNEQRIMNRAISDSTSVDAKFIADRSQGNPLFVVELVRHIYASKTVELHAAHERSLPPKLRAIIKQRINALSQSAESVIRCCAVLGKEFSLDSVSNICTASLDSVLHGVEELIEKKLLQHTPDKTLEFSHDCIHEESYALVPVSWRMELHRRVAESFVVEASSHTVDNASRIAHHFSQAGHHLSASDWYKSAAAQARKSIAYHEAARCMRSALKELDCISDGLEYVAEKVTIALDLDNSNRDLNTERPCSRDSHLRLEALVDNVDDLRLKYRVYEGLMWNYAFDRKSRKALKLSHVLLQVASEVDDPLIMMSANRRQAYSHFQMENYRAALVNQEHSISLGKAMEKLGTSVGAEFTTEMALAHIQSANVHLLCGLPEVAARKLQDLQKFQFSSQTPFESQHLLLLLADHYFERDDWSSMDTVSESMREIASSTKSEKIADRRDYMEGWVMAISGNADNGIALMDRAVQSHAKLKEISYQPRWFMRIAERQYAAGKYENALESTTKGLGYIWRARYRYWQTELIRIRAMTLHKLVADNDKVLRMFDHAVRNASRAGADLFLLRALIWKIRCMDERNLNSSTVRAELTKLLIRSRANGDSKETFAAAELLNQKHSFLTQR